MRTSYGISCPGNEGRLYEWPSDTAGIFTRAQSHATGLTVLDEQSARDVVAPAVAWHGSASFEKCEQLQPIDLYAPWLWKVDRESFTVWRGMQKSNAEKDGKFAYRQYNTVLHVDTSLAKFVRWRRERALRVDEIVSVVGWTG